MERITISEVRHASGLPIAKPRPYSPRPVYLTEADFKKLTEPLRIKVEEVQRKRRKRKAKRYRSQAQIAANKIAEAMRAAGRKPTLTLVTKEYERLYERKLPKVTAHRACR